MRRRLAAVAVFFLFSACVPQLRAQCPPAAREVVMRFLRLDFEGYRLSSKGHEAIWDVTDDDGDPPDIPVAVTKDYRIVSAEERNADCRLRVRIAVYGYISETGLFQCKPSNEEWNVIVRCAKDACRIRINFDDFKLYPHPGKDATMKWLEDLEAIRTTAAGKARERRLRERVASLR